MRAVFSLLGLVIVAALVLSMARKQAVSVTAAPAGAASSGGATVPAPKAIGQQVQRQLDEAAQRAADAAASATQ